jgi:CheY-like chemotaxis protein
MRWTLRDLLVEQRLASTVVACESGAELLQKFTERLIPGETSHLVILDILMKDLDGVAAAKAVRAVERAFEVKYQVPIIFLSALRLDASLRQFVARVQPALFLNKGVDATPDKLGARLRRLMEAFGSRRMNGGNGFSADIDAA